MRNIAPKSILDWFVVVFQGKFEEFLVRALSGLLTLVLNLKGCLKSNWLWFSALVDPP
jgi:hypothetical protein